MMLNYWKNQVFIPSILRQLKKKKKKNKAKKRYKDFLSKNSFFTRKHFNLYFFFWLRFFRLIFFLKIVIKNHLALYTKTYFYLIYLTMETNAYRIKNLLFFHTVLFRINDTCTFIMRISNFKIQCFPHLQTTHPSFCYMLFSNTLCPQTSKQFYVKCTYVQLTFMFPSG